MSASKDGRSGQERRWRRCSATVAGNEAAAGEALVERPAAAAPGHCWGKSHGVAYGQRLRCGFEQLTKWALFRGSGQGMGGLSRLPIARQAAGRTYNAFMFMRTGAASMDMMKKWMGDVKSSKSQYKQQLDCKVQTPCCV
jgi:hypothetical protein